MGPVAEMMKFTTATVIFTIFLVVSPVFSAPEIKPAEDRFFCMSTAEQTCANSCAGLDPKLLRHLRFLVFHQASMFSSGCSHVCDHSSINHSHNNYQDLVVGMGTMGNRRMAEDVLSGETQSLINN